MWRLESYVSSLLKDMFYVQMLLPGASIDQLGRIFMKIDGEEEGGGSLQDVVARLSAHQTNTKHAGEGAFWTKSNIDLYGPQNAGRRPYFGGIGVLCTLHGSRPGLPYLTN
jgi:hypothetical protein